MLKNWIKKDVLNQPPYKVKTIPYQIKLNQNESPWDWPIEIKERIAKSILASDWNRYPNLIPTELKKKIGEVNHIDNNGVVIGKGPMKYYRLFLQRVFVQRIRWFPYPQLLQFIKCWQNKRAQHLLNQNWILILKSTCQIYYLDQDVQN